MVGDPCPRKCCILAKAHWNNKKRPPNWRNRKFIDILKSLPLVDCSSTKATCPPEMDVHSDEETFEMTDGQDVANNEALFAERATLSQPESGEERSLPEDGMRNTQIMKQCEEPLVKKKRGRPRKYPKLEQRGAEMKTDTASSCEPTESSAAAPASLHGLKLPDLHVLEVDSDPLRWSPKDLWRFVRSSDCDCLADRLLHQEMDGASFMMLTLSTVKDYVTINLDLALRLCYLVGCVRLTYYRRFQSTS